MLEHEQAKSHLASGEFVVTHDASFPYAELTLLQALAPPGLVYPVRDLVQLIKEVDKRLLDLVAGPKDLYVVGITPDFRRACLARVPARQRQIDLKEGGGKEKPLAEIASDEGNDSRRALEIAAKIYKARNKGEVQNIEDLRTMLKTSPAPQVTRNALSSFGRQEVIIVQDNQEHLTGGEVAFPRQLDAPRRHVIQAEIKSGVDELFCKCKVRVLSCDTADETSNSLVGRQIPLQYVESSDGFLLLASQIARLPARIEVSITFDTLDDVPKHMALWQVLNKEEIMVALLESLQQADLGL